ncbi:MAG: transcriptional regulator [Methanosarcinaceae archaeon]|nr:transcriptional regulator [Methanosarcinaceae archaeon]MDD4332160.1 transcriptional regulator [Methanosarcinaceae archaeon]MDD4750096.1 transcriptional regulator [Methanosarcinaceae archaeon]
MNELIGFVNGNNLRQKVLALLASKGEMEGKRIAKILHIASPSMEKTLGELQEKELISEQEGKFVLTDTGEKVEKIVMSL